MDVYDGDQQTPLHKAVLYLQMEAIQVLAMNGADLNMRDGAGNTALHVSEGVGWQGVEHGWSYGWSREGLEVEQEVEYKL